jgi:uroporphyrinogen decarboxylase
MHSAEKPFLKAIRGEPTAHVPFWLMRQAGRYLPEYRAVRSQAGGFLDLCFNPELAAEVTLQPIRRFGMDAAIIFSDILVVPYALGQGLCFQEGEGPKLEPILTVSELHGLSETLDLARLAPVYAAITLVKAALPPETALIGFAGAPWTLATYVVEGGSSRDFKNVKSWAESDPDGFQKLIDRLTDAVIVHLVHQIQAGAEVVQLFDSWASALDGAAFDRWAVEPAKQIVAGVKQHYPEVPIIGFPRGVGRRAIGYAQQTGVDMISVDHSLPLHEIRDLLKPVVGVQGNLDPAILVEGGTVLENAVHEIVDALGGPRFIFNLGHGVVPQTPVAHVEQLAAVLRAQ